MRGGPDTDSPATPSRNEGEEMSLVKRMGDYIREVRAESAKVSWPSRKEVQAGTAVVLITVAILSVFIWGIDRIYLFLLGLLFGRSAT